VDAALGMVVTKRVIVPRTPAIAGNHNIGNKGRSVCQDGVGQEEGQRIRPSSQASLEAAASSATSVDSQPPFGTFKKQGCELAKMPRLNELGKETHRPNDLDVFGW